MRNVTLESTVNQTTCSPLSLDDYRKFLMYKERSVENLDFYLWFRSYQIRFSQLPKDVIDILTPCRSKKHENNLSGEYSLQLPQCNSRLSSVQEVQGISDLSNIGQKIDQHFLEYKSQLYQAQPFREEVNSIMDIFFTSGSFSELNIEASTLLQLRSEVIYTTHPSIFHVAAMEAYHLMEGDSFMRFKAEALKNLSPSTIHSRCAIGVVIMLLTITGVLITVLFKQTRWYRLILMPLVTCGVSYLVSSYRGICAAKVYARMREIKPHELFPLSNTDIPTVVERQYSEVEVVDSAIIREQQRILLIAFLHIILLTIFLMFLILLVPEAWS
ncbi:hypothetical protein K7432_014022 [Basidiobolus ranarum]|uniref:RGS domain-containing protein n=1 Tax=Basidiobolus ranarum TaxID=34480 RepID=A0ABR2VQ11_9FUNG